VFAESFRDRKVLITGGLGFIGSNLAWRLTREGATVTVVDGLAPGCGGNAASIAGLEDQLRVHAVEIREASDLQPVLEGAEYLFNLAGRSGHLASMREPAVDLESNCRAQLAILEACRAYNRDLKVVFTSTRQLYGRPRYLPVDEAHPTDPVDINGIHKLAAEGYHRLYHRAYGLRTTVLRLTNTYGPRMRIRDGGQNFLGLWIRRVLEGTPFEVWGGEQVRDFTYVEDAVEALLLAALRPQTDGEVFNLGGERGSLRRVAELLAELHPGSEFQQRPFPPERRSIDIGDYYADDRRFRNLTGWQPKTPLREGVAQTLSFFQGRWKEYV
jgi:UDP-glucose 4-epimerase